MMRHITPVGLIAVALALTSCAGTPGPTTTPQPSAAPASASSAAAQPSSPAATASAAPDAAGAKESGEKFGPDAAEVLEYAKYADKIALGWKAITAPDIANDFGAKEQLTAHSTQMAKKAPSKVDAATVAIQSDRVYGNLRVILLKYTRAEDKKTWDAPLVFDKAKKTATLVTADSVSDKLVSDEIANLPEVKALTLK